MAATAFTITKGLYQMMVAKVAADGGLAAKADYAKIGKVSEGTCQVTQDAATVTQFKEEGVAAPVFQNKTRNIPKIVLSIMCPTLQDLADFVGGEGTISGDGTSESPLVFGMNGNEEIANKSIKLVHETGLVFEVPNGDMEGLIADEASSTGQLLITLTITPQQPAKAGVKAFMAYMITDEIAA